MARKESVMRSSERLLQRARRWLSSKSSTSDAQALVAEIERNGVRALALRLGVADDSALTAAIDEAARALAKIDILVKNAGVLRLGTLDTLSLKTSTRRWP